jgi:hypothetical protein
MRTHNAKNSHKHARKQQGTGKYKKIHTNTSKYIIYTIIKKLTYWYTLQAHGRQRDEGARMPKIRNFLNKQFLTLEDGRSSPKYVVYFYKVTSVKTLLSVLNIDKPHKDGTMKSESETRSLI